MGNDLKHRTMTVRVADMNVSCETFGDGQPLLLIIGLGGVKELWGQEFIEPLAEDFQVIAYDSRGIGGTGAGRSPVSITQMASDAAGLLAALGIERSHLLGYSMGGYVAQELALTWPSMVDHLVLLGTECGGANGVRVEPGILFEFHAAQPSGAGETSRSFFLSADWLSENDTKVHDLFGTMGQDADRGSVEQQAEAMREWNGTCTRLAEIENPTLVVTGTHDIVILPENSRVLSELIPGSTLVEMEGGHHGMILQFPRQLAETISGFLKQ